MVGIVPRIVYVVVSKSVIMSLGCVRVSRGTPGMIVCKVRQSDTYIYIHVHTLHTCIHICDWI